MTRDIVETEEIEKDLLDGVVARLEQESESWDVLDYTGTGAEKILRYRFDEELGNGDSWYGQIDLSIHGDYFQARGDEVLISDYFAENRVQEIDVD